MPERQLPTREEVDSYFEQNNWGRWGDDDEVGAVNLITPEKRIAAAQLVRSGRAISVSRYFPKEPGPGNPNPADHWMYTQDRGPGSGFAADYLGIAFHGSAATHLDAICHIWSNNQTYNGRHPAQEITLNGAKFGAVDKWADGIFTRGVLLDVPKFRGGPHVIQDRSVHGWELEDVAAAGGIGRARRCPAGLQRAGCVDKGPSQRSSLARWYSPAPQPTEARSPRVLPAFYSRPRRVHTALGHDGLQSQRVRYPLGCLRRHLRLRGGPGR